MRRVIGLMGTVLTLTAGCRVPEPGPEEPSYPRTRQEIVTDVYHGEDIEDPYRWLENLGSPEVRQWERDQDDLFRSFLDNERTSRIEARITALSRLGGSYGIPRKFPGGYLLTRSEEGRRNPLLLSSRSLDALDEAKKILDLNEALAEEEFFRGFIPSPGGKYAALLVGEADSPWMRVRLLDVRSGSMLESEINGLLGSNLQWLSDESGFYYESYGEREELRSQKVQPRARVQFHALTAPHGPDRIVHAPEESEGWNFALNLALDDRYLVLSAFRGNDSSNALILENTEAGEEMQLLAGPDAAYTYLGSQDGVLYVYTDDTAARGRVIGIAVNRPARENWIEIIPEKNEPISAGSRVGGNAAILVANRIVLLYRRDVLPLIRVFDLEGHLLHEVELPVGYVGGGFVGRNDHPEVFFNLSRVLHGSVTWRLDVNTGIAEPIERRDLPFDPERFKVKQVHYESLDGTRIPMFVMHSRDLALNGRSPAFMYAYGYGGWVAIPWFQSHIIAWLEMGGVYALPNIRGGGEYGEEWEAAGVRLNRRNAINDFIAASQWLIGNGYTSPGLMVANGGSASGSLAAAAVIQRPDLYGAAVIDIPGLDMLRYHETSLFEGWTRGFGTAEDPAEYRVLRGYSPYHSLERDRCYPPFLVSVGEKDQVFPPHHGFKFIAALQNLDACLSPYHLKVVWDTGHALGATSEQTRETNAQQIAWLTQVLEWNPSIPR